LRFGKGIHLWRRIEIERRLEKNQVNAGVGKKRDASHIMPKAKCPFTPQREMVLNLFGENLP
jgi:hypothetical protein